MVYTQTKNLIKKLDFMGTPFSLNYKDSSSFNTVIGGCLSTFCGFISLIVLVYLMLEFFDSSSVELTITEISSRTFPSYDLYDSKNFVYLVYGGSGRILSEANGEGFSNFFTAIGRNRYAFINYEFDPPRPEIKYSYFEYVPCNSTSEYIKKAYSVSDVMKFWLESIGRCPKFDDPSVYNVGGSLLYGAISTVDIFIYPCSLEDTSKCVSNDQLEGVQLYPNHAAVLFDHTNEKNPID